MTRKAISVKTRFEVFKRDQFKCQYCGKSAPEVILHVDHIVPVSKKGGNEILNLVTSCIDCNLGKSNRALDDQSTLIKQRAQAEALEEIRQQKEMMGQWISSLSGMLDQEVEIMNSYMSENYEVYLNDYGKSCLKKNIKKYGINEVKESMDISADTYLKDRDIPEQRANFINKIERICYYRALDKKDPVGAEIRNITNLANKVWFNCNWRTLIIELKAYHKGGWTLEELRECVLKTSGIMAFYAAMEESNG